MKWYLAVLFALFFYFAAYPQSYYNAHKYENLHDLDGKFFSWGYFVGMSRFNFKLVPKRPGGFINETFSIETIGGTGFHSGLLSKVQICKYLDLVFSLGLLFVKRGVRFRKDQAFTSYSLDKSAQFRSINSTYLSAPLLLNFYGDRFYNLRPFLSAGLGYVLNLESSQGKQKDNSQGVFRMKTHNLNWQIQGGMSFYFPYFKMNASIGGLFFINNELVPDYPHTPPLWAGSIESMKTRAVLISIEIQ